MFKLVGVNEQDGQKAFAILNTEDGQIEAITEKDMKIGLNYNLSIEGASLSEAGDIVFDTSLLFTEDDEDDYDTEYESEYEDDEEDEEDEEWYDDSSDEIDVQVERYARELTRICEKSPEELVNILTEVYEQSSDVVLIQGTSQEYGVVQFRTKYDEDEADYIWGIDNEWYDDLDEAIDDFIGYIDDSDGTDTYGDDTEDEEDDSEDYEDEYEEELSQEELDEINGEQWEEATNGAVYFDGEEYVYKTNKIILPPFNNGNFANPDRKFWGNVADFNFEDDDESDGLTGEDKKDLSVQSKLFTYLDEPKMQLLQKYFLYISQFVFELDRGNVALKPSKKADFDAVKAEGRDLSHQWYYAGFIDTAYRGTSVCPNCGVRLRYNAISSCCHMPVYRLDVERDGKKALVNDEGKALGVWKRTHNGQCIKCGSKCDCVRTKVGTRDIDRNSNDLICANCGEVVKQSNHYCTLNHQTRFIHLAWDITNSDMETFNGQVIDADINEIIESKDCIKFGLDCVADFFEIAKDSEAFKVLQKVQQTCIKDMTEMAEIYEQYNGDISEVNNSFIILDKLVPILQLKGVKYTFMKKNTYIPTRLLKLYIDMRKEGILIPRSMIQFIRDYLVDWDMTERKFSDGAKNFPYLKQSIGCIGGAKKGKSNSDCVDRVALVLEDGWKKPDELIKQWKEGYASSWEMPRNFVSRYLTAFFLYKICGYYQYDAEKYTDEGGRGKGHQKELDEFYTSLNFGTDGKFNSIEYTYEYVELLNQALPYLYFSDYSLDLAGKMRKLYMTKGYGTERDYSANIDRVVRHSYDSFIKEVIDAYDSTILEKIDKLEELFNYKRKRQIKLDNITYTLQDYMNDVKPLVDYLTEKAQNFGAFADSYIEEIIDKENEAILIRKQEEEQERQRELDKMRMEEELNKQTQTQLPQQQVSQPSNQPATTQKEVIEWLSNANLDNFKGEFALKILKSVKGKTSCSDKQFKYLVDLYEKASGNKYGGTVSGGKMDSAVPITDEDIKVIDYMLAHRDLLDERTLAIISSVKNYGKATDKQRKYVDDAIAKYKEVNGQ